ncbi:MAG: mechanosensitive ion channel family protein [Planctomycetota bacterium]|nr:mechanosensitive ion channel family protein [Planctomycetota bacterium]
MRLELEDDPLDAFSVSNAWDLLLKSLQDMFRGFVQHLPNLLIALVVIALTWALASGARRIYWRLVQKRRLRRSLKDLFEKLILIAIWCIGLLAASIVVFPSVKPESILAGLGLSSIAIGFAFKDVVENFFAGFLILIREPLEMGDFIKCQDVEGKVESITIRDTLIRQTDGQRVIVPNAMLFKNPVWIRTDQEVRRTSVTCGVAYDVDLEQAQRVIRGAVEGLESVAKGRDVQVYASEFGSSSVDFEVTWWTGSKPGEVRRSRDEVLTSIKGALDEAGIEIPFPYRTLTFKEALRVDRAGEGSGATEGEDD